MNFGLLGQATVLAIILAAIATPLIGRWLHARRVRTELRNLLATSNEGWAREHRAWMERRRSGKDVHLSKGALIEIAEEEARAFALDYAPDVPTPPRNAA